MLSASGAARTGARLLAQRAGGPRRGADTSRSPGEVPPTETSVQSPQPSQLSDGRPVSQPEVSPCFDCILNSLEAGIANAVSIFKRRKIYLYMKK